MASGAADGVMCTNPVDPTNSSSPVVHTDSEAVSVALTAVDVLSLTLHHYSQRLFVDVVVQVYIQPANPDHSVEGTAQQMTGVPMYPPPANSPVKMDGFVANCA
jgi:hypothetical protein